MDDDGPCERHRRRLAAFARWLAIYRSRDAATRKSIESLAEDISSGKIRGRELEDSLDYLDDLLF